jgi:hypothetical protein
VLEQERKQARVRDRGERHERKGLFAIVSGCTFLGGHGVALQSAEQCTVLCYENGFDLIGLDADVPIPYTTVSEAEISERGRFRTGGGLVGGGIVTFALS